MKRIIFAILTLTTICLTSCDDGLIYPETAKTTEGKTVKVEGVISGFSNWSSNYRLSLAGFENSDDEYATITKTISSSDIVDGKLSIELSGLGNDISTVRFCVLDRLRRHIVTFREADVSSVTDVMTIDVNNMNVSMFNTIQQSYLSTTCANCHGASNRIAAGLDLTEGKAYEAMVGVDSKKVDGKKIVAPNDAANSVLHMVLNQESVEGIGMNHFDLVSEKNAQSILPLIDSWINNGAKKE